MASSLHELPNFDRKDFESTITTRFFYGPSFHIYQGIAMVKGLWDLGPMGCAMKSNVLNHWRNHFVIRENMLEIECSQLTPKRVFNVSGHVEKFTDLMVQDEVTKDYFRADHLLEDVIKKKITDKKTCKDLIPELERDLGMVDAWSASLEELSIQLKRYNVKSPETNNNLTEPLHFNLMFATDIGPTGKEKGFLRPETAQGIFVNFKRLLGFNQGKMPFAAAQIGTSFRNEISPKNGILRAREFPMAEIEHFYHPDERNHPNFKNVSEIQLNILTAKAQLEGTGCIIKTIGEAVSEGLMTSEIIAYYVGRIYEFLTAAGIKKEFLRFRQHMDTEMAHYARDCWDAEALTSYGWVEITGCADRSAFDLTRHGEATNTPMIASKRLDEPLIQQVRKIDCVMKKLGPSFGKKSKLVKAHFEGLDQEGIDRVANDLSENQSHAFVLEGEQVSVTNDQIFLSETTKKLFEIQYVPNVIEPSFGITRIIYAILEQNFYCREGNRNVFGFPVAISPVTVCVFPLVNSDELYAFVDELSLLCRNNQLNVKVDQSSTAIGRKYARFDEIGCAFAVTVDFDTITDETVTLRERDSTEQIRLPVKDVADVVRDLKNLIVTWKDIKEKYGN